MTSTAASTAHPDPIRALVATVAAVVLAVVTRALAGIADIEVLVPAGPGSEELTPLSVGRIVVVVVVVALVGYTVRVLLDRVLPRRSITIVTVLAVLVLLLSAVPVLAADLTDENAVVLGVMHLVVAAPLIRDVVRG